MPQHQVKEIQNILYIVSSITKSRQILQSGISDTRNNTKRAYIKILHLQIAKNPKKIHMFPNKASVKEFKELTKSVKPFYRIDWTQKKINIMSRRVFKWNGAQQNLKHSDAILNYIFL